MSTSSSSGATNPHTVSTPELLSDVVVPELVGRTRSWSTQSEAGLERRPPNRLHKPGAACSSLGRSSTFSEAPLPVSTGERAPYTRGGSSGKQRPASIYSKSGSGGSVGSPDGQALRVQPQVATTSAGGSHPVMARGQIIAPQIKPRPQSSSGLLPPTAATMRKQALSMMKPLVLNGAQSDGTFPSAAAAAEASPELAKDNPSLGNASTTVDSASSHCTSSSSRRGSCNSATASDTDATAGLLNNPRQRLGSKAGAVVGAVLAPNEQPSTNDSKDHNQQQQESPPQGVVWSTYSWLTRRASSGSASQHALDTSDSLRRSAVTHLRDIQAQQPEQPVVSTPELESTTDDVLVPDQLPDDVAVGEAAEPTAGSKTGEQHAAALSDARLDANVASATGSVAGSSTRWAWGWFGAGKGTNEPNISHSELAASSSACQPDEHTDNLHDLPLPASDLDNCVSRSDRVATDLGVSNRRAAHTPSQRPLVNMLVPDLDFDSALASSVTDTLVDSPSEPDSSKLDDEAYGSGLSWHERMHGLGKALLQGAVAIAPDWARLAVQGHVSADALGQLDGSSDRGESPGRSNPQKIKDAMDVSAHKLGKIAVIGVHGWFPTRMLQMISGEPTGKSEKFCVMMRDAIKEYLQDAHGIHIDNSDI
ncbi:hypothetical protein IWW38_003760, partial [Coemansia aciculifera]